MTQDELSPVEIVGMNQQSVQLSLDNTNSNTMSDSIKTSSDTICIDDQKRDSSNESIDKKQERTVNKKKKQAEKKLRQAKAEFKKQEIEIIKNSLPTGASLFITFKRGQKEYQCGLVYREEKITKNKQKGTSHSEYLDSKKTSNTYIVMDTTNSNIRKLVLVGSPEYNEISKNDKAIIPQPGKGHWALVFKQGNEWVLQKIPKVFIESELLPLAKKGYIPLKPDDTSYGCITLQFESCGHSWKVFIFGEHEARQLRIKQKEQFELVNKTIDDIEHDQKETQEQQEYDADWKEYSKEFFKKIQNNTNSSNLNVSKDLKRKDSISIETKQPLKKYKKMSLEEFQTEVRDDIRQKMSVKDCPNMQKEYGCCVKSCKFNHPSDWDWKICRKNFEASLKKETSCSSSSSSTPSGKNNGNPLKKEISCSSSSSTPSTPLAKKNNQTVPNAPKKSNSNGSNIANYSSAKKRLFK